MRKRGLWGSQLRLFFPFPWQVLAAGFPEFTRRARPAASPALQEIVRGAESFHSLAHASPKYYTSQLWPSL